MTTLTQAQRDEVWAQVMEHMSRQGTRVSLDKHQVATAVAALDDGIGQSVGMVDAFLGPETASALDTATKYHMFGAVLMRRLQEGI